MLTWSALTLEVPGTESWGRVPPAKVGRVTTTKTPAILNTLQIAAGISALLGLVQLVLGFMMTGGNFSVLSLHSTVAMMTLVAAVVAAVAAVMWQRASSNKGLMMHAVGMAIIGLAQFALGEIGGGLVMVHVIVGVAFLVGAGALATLAVRKPGTAA